MSVQLSLLKIYKWKNCIAKSHLVRYIATAAVREKPFMLWERTCMNTILLRMLMWNQLLFAHIRKCMSIGFCTRWNHIVWSLLYLWAKSQAFVEENKLQPWVLAPGQSRTTASFEPIDPAAGHFRWLAGWLAGSHTNNPCVPSPAWVAWLVEPAWRGGRQIHQYYIIFTSPTLLAVMETETNILHL